jgi:hypothetical protein
MKKLIFSLFALAIVLASCNPKPADQKKTAANENEEIRMKVEEFVPVKLTTDVSKLTESEKQMIPLMIEAAQIMDKLFWEQAYGDKAQLMAEIQDPWTKKFAEINYGPWERLNGNKPFVKGVGPKPKGACFYPKDMTVEEFEAFDNPEKTSLYTLIRRDDEGNLIVVPYSEAYKEELTKAADLIRKAAELAEDPGLKKYLSLRADALLNDDYYPSDNAWMDMKNNGLDFVVGPIENYEDKLFEYKTAFESFVLVKDKDWSSKVLRYASLLPELQTTLPVADEYKKEVPGSSSDLGVYDAVYYAGDCNAGSKTIAINLPNDPRIHVDKGSRKLQLKNSMKAKFDKILVPISEILIAEDQRKHIKFDAFFENTMFHEVGHGLGIKQTINGKGGVREALKDTYSAIEEGKADILGLYLVTKLNEMGEFENKDLMDNFVTFMAGIFRSVRFGVSSSHGMANMVRFYYFQEKGAFTRDEATGTYRVNFDKMKQAMIDLAEMILTIQGDGNYDAAKKLLDEKGSIRPELQADLDRISDAHIPRDIVFEQGVEVLGLK